MAAASALHRHGVAVACVVADLVETLAAHGLRLIAQIKLAADVITAASASRIAELSTSIDHLRFVEVTYVHIMFHVGKWLFATCGELKTRPFIRALLPLPHDSASVSCSLGLRLGAEHLFSTCLFVIGH